MNTTLYPTVYENLSRYLASTYMLYLKTQNYHWHVTGPHFYSLHNLFGAQYSALAETIDDLAERIRSIGGKAPATFQEYLHLSFLEENQPAPTAETMLSQLQADHHTMAERGLTLIEIAEKVGDYATVDQITARVHAHQKEEWILRSTLSK